MQLGHHVNQKCRCKIEYLSDTSCNLNFVTVKVETCSEQDVDDFCSPTDEDWNVELIDGRVISPSMLSSRYCSWHGIANDGLHRRQTPPPTGSPLRGDQRRSSLRDASGPLNGRQSFAMMHKRLISAGHAASSRDRVAMIWSVLSRLMTARSMTSCRPKLYLLDAPSRAVPSAHNSIVRPSCFHPNT